MTQQPDAAVVHDSAFYGTWPQRRVVALTQGTVANHDLTDLVQPTLDALAGEDVLVVAGLGGREIAPGDLRVPSNARVESFTPSTRCSRSLSVSSPRRTTTDIQPCT
ncbi:hypothetical protein AB0K12_48005 [Nonomuraea sp. NPDC049419]|uniref:hypothetical protein n=1 Tax=Nonomuraea sp. NPDC049419 TaxID=3155772 RepID=UPI0034218061